MFLSRSSEGSRTCLASADPSHELWLEQCGCLDCCRLLQPDSLAPDLAESSDVDPVSEDVDDGVAVCEARRESVVTSGALTSQPHDVARNVRTASVSGGCTGRCVAARKAPLPGGVSTTPWTHLWCTLPGPKLSPSRCMWPAMVSATTPGKRPITSRVSS